MQLIVGILVLTTLILWTNTFYIHAKARLAQILIKRSWATSQMAPWPWADTHPVARLRFNTHESYVLAGAHGTSLAFGPGHVDGTALPGTSGISVLAGHRDTHFAFLAEMAPGDRFEVQRVDGRWLTYEVFDIEIVDTTASEVMSLTEGGELMVLVTCYPFDAIEAGGPYRYVVRGRRLNGENLSSNQPPVVLNAVRDLETNLPSS